MISQVMSFINDALSAAGNWFLAVFTRSGMTELYLALLFIVFSFKFILSPIFGRSRGSDKARTKKEVNSDE